MLVTSISSFPIMFQTSFPRAIRSPDCMITFSQTTNFSLSSKQKEFADDNFKFDENARKFSKSVENAVGKGEIACYEQFLLFPQCFQKTCTVDT